MKLITAIIRERKLTEVREALIEAKITRITVTTVSGHGNQVQEQIYRGQKSYPNLIPKIKLEIAVNEEFVDTTVNTIINAARTGEVGDGKIFITDIRKCIRIRTGETDSEAI
jgi:nitrogen regulatory protein P-II 1